MSGSLAVFRRELRAYFFSPLAYVILAFFLVVQGYYFSLIVAFLSDPRASAGKPLELFFGQTIFTWLVLLFCGTFLTMRLISEELRSGTIETLMTAPVTETQVVLGKYFAALVFYLFLWAPTLLYVAIVRAHTPVDWGPIAAAYIGIFGIGALFLSVGEVDTTRDDSTRLAARAGGQGVFVTLEINPEMIHGFHGLSNLIPEGHAALAVMEQHLTGRSFFVGERYSIADIALYAYTHVAPEGGFELASYPAIRAWLERVRAEPRHIPITKG